MKENKPTDKLGQNTLKSAISLSNDLLKTLINLSSALLGVGFIFNDFVKTPWVRIIVILFFFISLIVAFLGVLPFNVKYDIEEEQQIREQEIKTFRRKRTHLWLSSGILALGLFCAILDITLDFFIK